jgi:hypothetical protein
MEGFRPYMNSYEGSKKEEDLEIYEEGKIEKHRERK